jgi:hypothetical protein
MTNFKFLHAADVHLDSPLHRGAETIRVVGIGRAIIHHDPLDRHDLQNAHEVREALLLALEYAHHVEPSDPAFADIPAPA